MKVQDFIRDFPAPLRVTDTAREARDRFMELSSEIHHLPVLDDEDILVGILDAEALKETPDILQIGLLRFEAPVFVETNAHTFDAAKILAEYHLTILPVTLPNRTYIGLIEFRTLFERLSHLLGIHKSGAVVVVEMPVKDYTLSELIRLLEQNDTKIFSVTSELPEFEGAMARITLKLNTPDATRIRHVLEHYRYRVSEYYDVSNSEELQRRVKELMRYLEV